MDVFVTGGIPFYALASLVPAWRHSARRLGLVSIGQMVDDNVPSVWPKSS